MNRRFLLLALLLCLLLPLSAFAGSGKGEAGAGKTFNVVLIGKLKHPMFDNTFIGMQKAAKELGGLNVTMVNPAEADAAQQVAVVEDQIAKGVDAILVVPNDPGALEQVFKKANDAGIKTFTHESVLSKNVTFDIEAFDNATFGRHHMDNLAKYTNGEGGYICFVGNLTAVTHNQWVDAEIAWQKEKYPKMHLLRDRLVSDEKTEVAYAKTLEAIKTYGDELRGVIGSLSGPGLEDGSIKVVSIWNPQNIGYAAAFIIKNVLEGKPVTNGMDVPALGKITINGKVIYGDASGILDITKENYKNFSF
jgi:simple sugar transport system substrate-binding protein